MNSNKKEWCLAFPEPDQAVIVRSIHHARTVEKLPYNFEVRNYMVFGSLIGAVIAVFVFLLLSIMATFEPIRILLVRVSWALLLEYSEIIGEYNIYLWLNYKKNLILNFIII